LDKVSFTMRNIDHDNLRKFSIKKMEIEKYRSDSVENIGALCQMLCPYDNQLKISEITMNTIENVNHVLDTIKEKFHKIQGKLEFDFDVGGKNTIRHEDFMESFMSFLIETKPLDLELTMKISLKPKDAQKIVNFLYATQKFHYLKILSASSYVYDRSFSKHMLKKLRQTRKPPAITSAKK